jgi:hypothetical protein
MASFDGVNRCTWARWHLSRRLIAVTRLAATSRRANHSHTSLAAAASRRLVDGRRLHRHRTAVWLEGIRTQARGLGLPFLTIDEDGVVRRARLKVHAHHRRLLHRTCLVVCICDLRASCEWFMRTTTALGLHRLAALLEHKQRIETCTSASLRASSLCALIHAVQAAVLLVALLLAHVSVLASSLTASMLTCRLGRSVEHHVLVRLPPPPPTRACR